LHVARFLAVASYMVASTSVFADPEMERSLIGEAKQATGHGLVFPSGALWGCRDIQKMGDAGSLAGLHVTIKKHPMSLKLKGALGVKMAQVLKDGRPEETLLFDGSIAELCGMAPNNVNTIATAALAAKGSLNFADTRATLICDPRLETMVPAT
jgi:aspartate dehydrogenase